VGDWLGRWDREPNVDLIQDVDVEAFIEHLFGVLRAGLSG
jgi:purine nucleosidase/pyrimidine-specific ribonucleoside hydrolase